MRASNKEQRDRTRTAIQHALLDMMKEYPIDELSITDIAKRAGVSRNAFYRHYSSKTEVVRDYMNNVSDRFYEGLGKVTDLSSREYLEKTFAHIYEHRDMMRLLYDQNMSGAIGGLFIEYAEKILYANSLNGYTAVYMGGGFYSMTIHWIKNGCVESPELMASIALAMKDEVEKVSFND